MKKTRKSHGHVDEIVFGYRQRGQIVTADQEVVINGLLTHMLMARIISIISF